MDVWLDYINFLSISTLSLSMEIYLILIANSKNAASNDTSSFLQGEIDIMEEFNSFNEEDVMQSKSKRGGNKRRSSNLAC